VATNQAVMGAIARARYNQLFRYPTYRLDCDFLHPNTNRQTTGVAVCLGAKTNDYNYIGITSGDVGFTQGVANASAQWTGATTYGSIDIADNVNRKISCLARANQVSYVENDSIKTTDVSCELNSGYNKVFVGDFLDGSSQPGCLISRIRLTRNDKRS
jgi:hypothetical protein